MDASPVIVQVAMADEAAPFLKRASVTGEALAAGEAVLHHLEIDGDPVLLVHTGIGFVNAAAGTTAAMQEVRRLTGANPRLVISAGTAGGLGDGVEVGDVVVGSEYLNMDADARVFGYALGQVPGMPAVYSGDPAMLAAVPQLDAVIAGHVRTGLIGSSYSFVTADRAAIARRDFPTVAAVDMESSAIAQVCWSNRIPYVAVRGISDLADGSAADAHVEYVDLTADHSAAVVLALARLAAQA